MMQDNGLIVEHIILSDDEYIKASKFKLVEEANEVAYTTNLSEIKTDLADILEVFGHLLDVYKIDIIYS